MNFFAWLISDKILDTFVSMILGAAGNDIVTIVVNDILLPLLGTEVDSKTHHLIRTVLHLTFVLLLAYLLFIAQQYN